MRTLRLAALLPLLLLLIVPRAYADNVDPGDFIKFSDRPGSPGGEFGVTVKDTYNGSAVDSFVTFCLQKTEYIDFSSTFIVGSITDHTLTDPASKGGNAAGEDPISSNTAWLYTNFRKADYGALGALGYNGTSMWANRLQNAFWYFEDELTAAEKTAQDSNVFVLAAKAALQNGWSGIGSVRVMNLYKYDNNNPNNWREHEAQDQLVLVPEPSSLVLFGSGVFALCFRRRQSLRQA